VSRSLWPVLIVLLVVGCGEDPPPASDAGALAAEPGDFPERTAGGGMLHLVRLVHAGDRYAFAPDTVVVEPGDGIRFVHTSYQPESVAFDPAGLDAAARAVLAEQDALSGRLLTAPGAAFDVHLEGLEPGSYRFFSRPHVQAGAEGVVRILSAD
jgi:plastocyanin